MSQKIQVLKKYNSLIAKDVNFKNWEENCGVQSESFKQKEDICRNIVSVKMVDMQWSNNIFTQPYYISLHSDSQPLCSGTFVCHKILKVCRQIIL